MLKMPFTGKDKTPHPDAVWSPGNINVNPFSKTGVVLFKGYHDIHALQAAIAGQDVEPIAEHPIYLNPQNWDAALQAANLDLTLLLTPCDALAMMEKDVEVVIPAPPPEEGEQPGEDEIIFESFFKTAIPIS